MQVIDNRAAHLELMPSARLRNARFKTSFLNSMAVWTAYMTKCNYRTRGVSLPLCLLDACDRAACSRHRRPGVERKCSVLWDQGEEKYRYHTSILQGDSMACRKLTEIGETTERRAKQERKSIIRPGDIT